jgi:hypothetical protein
VFDGEKRFILGAPHELLNMVVDQGPTARLLIVLTCRPEFQSPWGLRTHLTPLALQRLSPLQVAGMVEQVTGGRRLPVEVQQQIVARTDGVPLFVEEVTKLVVESGLLTDRRPPISHYSRAPGSSSTSVLPRCWPSASPRPSRRSPSSWLTTIPRLD